jgi:nucleosome binding factor SPN SPT16 subunit
VFPTQKKVGVLTKDTSSGPFVDEWKRAYGDISKEVEEVDIALAISAAALSVKDENELVRIARRCRCASILD